MEKNEEVTSIRKIVDFENIIGEGKKTLGVFIMRMKMRNEER